MKQYRFHHFPRDIEAGNLIEYFLVSAAANVLFWRFYLHITGYPKIIFGEFYLPHVLTGGILMTVALMLLFIFINREIKYLAAIVGGAGFGLFIDELGKFITQDSNYFYRPAIAIIYVIFIILFLVSRAAENFFQLSKEEYGINALEIMKNVLLHKFASDDKQQVINLIKQSDNDNPVIFMLSKTLKELKANPANKNHLFHLVKEFLKNLYKRIVYHPFFTKLIVSSFVIISLANFVGAIYNFKYMQDFSTLGEIVFSFLSGLIVFIGAQLLIYRVSRIVAYHMFKYAVLVSIFLTQFFRFLNDQLSAVFVLILLLVVLSVLQYSIYQENLMDKNEKVD